MAATRGIPIPQHQRPLADGTHAGLRWWLCRLPGDPGQILTFSGFIDARYRFDQIECFVTTRTAVAALIDQALAGRGTR